MAILLLVYPQILFFILFSFILSVVNLSFNKGERSVEYSALVIRAERDKALADLLAIARVEAMKRHGLKHKKVDVLEIVYIPRLNVYAALYRTPEVRGGRMKNEK